MTKPAAIVLCAGQGTRMKSSRAKVLHPLLGRPLCSFPISRALEFGADPVVAVVGHQAKEVEAAVGDAFSGRPLRFAVQTEQLGTAHAVLSAKEALAGHEGPILILYGDVPLITSTTLKALTAERKSGAQLAIVTTHPKNPTGYGRVVRQEGRLLRIVEEKDCTPEQRQINEVNAGIYLAEASLLWDALSQVGRKNSQREFYLTDLVEVATRQGLAVAAVDAPPEEVAGVNDRVELARAATSMRDRINEAHMRAGVTLLDPARIVIEEPVRVGEDTELGPDIHLLGSTRLGKGVRVGQGCVIQDCDVADGVEIRPYCVLEQAVVGPGCIVGPFARLRPGTTLADGVHIGNFVETKKARIGKGSKANHLSYLGDAEIGAGVNVGAGTITCNYDGVNKHPTVLEDGVFVGSDSQFVAPVKVGKDAYIGAGSTIVEDVPAGSLAVARGRQVIKEGWVKKNAPAKKAGKAASK